MEMCSPNHSSWYGRPVHLSCVWGDVCLSLWRSSSNICYPPKSHHQSINVSLSLYTQPSWLLSCWCLPAAPGHSINLHKYVKKVTLILVMSLATAYAAYFISILWAGSNWPSCRLDSKDKHNCQVNLFPSCIYYTACNVVQSSWTFPTLSSRQWITPCASDTSKYVLTIAVSLLDKTQLKLKTLVFYTGSRKIIKNFKFSFFHRVTTYIFTTRSEVTLCRTTLRMDVWLEEWWIFWHSLCQSLVLGQVW